MDESEAVELSGFGLAPVAREMTPDEMKKCLEAVRLRPVNPSGYTPTEFKVLIRPDPVEEKIGSIIMPDQKKDADKFKQTEGTIVAVSPLAFSYASEADWTAANAVKPKPGDRVLYAKFEGTHIKGKDGTEYLIVNDKSICATID